MVKSLLKIKYLFVVLMLLYIVPMVCACDSDSSKTYSVTTGHNEYVNTVSASGGVYNSNLTISWTLGSEAGYTYSLDNVKIYAGTDSTGTLLATYTSGTSATYKMSETYYENIYVYVTASRVTKEYSINYELNGGTNASNNPNSFTKESEIIVLANPTKEGYTFVGWYSDEDYTTKVTKIEKGSTDNITLYAKWIAKTYSITSGYNEYVDTVIVASKGTYNSDLTISWTLGSAVGYTYSLDNVKVYAGTNTTGTLLTTYTRVTSATYKMSETYYDNIYVYVTASRVAKTYSVTSGHNEYVDAVNVVNTCIYNNDLTISWTLGSAVGYTYSLDNVKVYAGTNTTGTLLSTYTSGTSAIYKMSETYYENIYVYVTASRVANSYSITYCLDGGVNSASNPSSFTIETPTITLQDATKTGYGLLNWYSDANYQNVVTKIQQGSTGNIVLYAVWSDAGLYQNNVMVKSWKNLLKDGDITYNCNTCSINGCLRTLNGNLKILNRVTHIEDYVFNECTNLTSITIPSSVTSIGEYAFKGCISLKSVTFENNSQLTSIKRQTFCFCTSLVSITIPSGVISIEPSAFYGCTSLASVTIPSSVTSIGICVFYNCTSLSSVTIQRTESIEIGSWAFGELDTSNPGQLKLNGTGATLYSLSNGTRTGINGTYFLNNEE